MMNTLYMHIGTTKTATTAIQSFCINNQKQLNSLGCCYPLFPYRYKDVSERRNAHFMIAEDAADRKTGVFKEGMDKISQMFSTYPKIILSDEGIWSAPYKKRAELWKALKKESGERGFQVKIIVYLRRQDTYLISGWNQMVKSGIGTGAAKPWDQYVDGLSNIHKMNYAEHLRKLADIWGRENLIVRRFEPKRFIGGSIYADFLNAAGIEFTDEFEVEKSVRNVRLEGNTQEIQRVLNGMPGMNAEYHSFFRQVLLNFAEMSGAEYPCEMFSKEEAEAFMEKYSSGNRQVAEEFFGEEELFDLKWKDVPKWEKENPHMLDDIIRFTGACCMRLEEENRQMRMEIQELKKDLEDASLKYRFLRMAKKGKSKLQH